MKFGLYHIFLLHFLYQNLKRHVVKPYVMRCRLSSRDFGFIDIVVVRCNSIVDVGSDTIIQIIYDYVQLYVDARSGQKTVWGYYDTHTKPNTAPASTATIKVKITTATEIFLGKELLILIAAHACYFYDVYQWLIYRLDVFYCLSGFDKEACAVNWCSYWMTSTRVLIYVSVLLGYIYGSHCIEPNISCSRGTLYSTRHYYCLSCFDKEACAVNGRLF